MTWMFKRKCILELLIFIIALFGIHMVVYADSVNPNISFTIISPAINTTQYDDLKVVISKPVSSYQISEVRVKVEGKEITLAYADNAYSSYGENNPGWVGHLDLKGLTRGEKTLEVTVKDVNGNTTTKETQFNYTEQPSLVVHSTQDSYFSSGELTISAEASDSAGEKCTIKVYMGGYGSEELAEAAGQMNTKVDLSKYSGQAVNLRFEASNETGGMMTEIRTVYVDNSALLKKEDQVNGEILDYNYDRILYKTADNEVRIKDLQTSNETSVYSNAKNTVSYGYLTPSGAMLVIQNVDPYYICDSLFEYKNNSLTYLGRMNSNSSLKVNGHYAIWSGDLKPFSSSGIASGEELYLINVDTDQIKQVSNTAGNWMNDVTADGDVIYWTNSGWSGAGDTTFNYNVYKYADGTITKLSADDSYFNVYPLSNGNLTVYEKHRYNGDVHYLMLNINGQDETLAESANDFSPGRDYLINNNYVAYTKPVNGTRQIFIWKNGVSKQITFSGMDASIVSLNTNGDVVARYNNGFSLIKNDGSQPIRLYSIDLKNDWENNSLYGVIGGAILSINTNPILVSEVALSKSHLVLNEAEAYSLTASVFPSNATNQKVKWISNNEKVAVVDSVGKITAKSAGTAIITVTTEDGNKRASCTVMVKDVTAPDKPVVNQVTDQSTIVTGTSEAGTSIVVKKGSSVIGSGTVKDDGTFSLPISVQTAGTELAITAADGAGNTSEPTVVIVKKAETTGIGNTTGTSGKENTPPGTLSGITLLAGEGNSFTMSKAGSEPSALADYPTASTSTQLADTATNMYNLLVIGTLLIIAGIILFGASRSD